VLPVQGCPEEAQPGRRRRVFRRHLGVFGGKAAISAPSAPVRAPITANRATPPVTVRPSIRRRIR